MMAELFLISIISSVIFGTLGVLTIYNNKKYKETAYYQITKNPYSSVKHDKGKLGEYLTYKQLQHIENSGGKFLFNVYIPKSNNETTEIDILLICSKGLFVFESKNYGGWIFGNDAHKNWTQVFPKGWGNSHKERFYNPIKQNASHIRHLRSLLRYNAPIQSIIVFSERCTLKDITIRSSNVAVINRYDILSAVTQIYDQTQDNLLTEAEINDIYNKLYPYTQVGCEVIEQHTNNLQVVQ